MVCGLPAISAEPPATDTEISVSGNASISAAPDQATVDATVETNAPSSEAAVNQNNAIYDRVIAALEKAGVARSDISLGFYNVNYNPKPANPPPDAGTRWGFTVSRGFIVKVRSIGKAGSVVDACTAAGATAINGVSFGIADDRVLHAQAVTKAVADARANAEALARAAGLHIVGIKRIDSGGGPLIPQPLMRMAAAIAPSTQFDQSNVTVSATVSVTFLAAP